MSYSRKHIIDALKAKIGKPMLLRELMRQLRLKPEDRSELKHILTELILTGEIIKTRGNRYGLPEKMDLETGTFQAHSDGYGFVIPEKKGASDVYISARSRLDAMDGDKVVVRLSKPAGKKRDTGRREGVIIRILERAHTKIVGTYETSEDRPGVYGFVTPSDPRIIQDVMISPENTAGSRSGDIVSAEIITYPVRGRPAEGKVVKLIGKKGQPGIESELIIEEYELPTAFSPAALREAAVIPQQVTAAMRRGRRDLRDLPTVTIDGEKARDFDDALSIDKIRNGYRLWVHIADVAYYVKEDTIIDQEAYQRGTSVYLPDRAIPMLPPELSNGICSLNPDVDRLAFTVEMDFSGNGEILNYDIYESVIKSSERMTYTAVREILADRDPAQRRRYAGLLEKFELMDELMEILRLRRTRRGSIDFDLPEPEIVLDLQGRMTDVIRAERNRAHQIVEEFMIAANETVAGHMEKMEAPFIYRIHEEPDEEKIRDLTDFLDTLDIKLHVGKKLKPSVLQKAVTQAKGAPEEALVNTVVLRTMKQARYSSENVGHFGLASRSYTHFTSPIRRYPDLVVHRLLKAAAHGLLRNVHYVDRLSETLPDTADHCSLRERTAMEAERDVISMLKLLFMKDKLGETYDGIITGVAPFGFFVQLSELFVEGLVHISTLTDDYYHYVDKQHCLRGERRKCVFRIGDKVRVRVDRVDRERKRIDFSLSQD